MILVSGGTGFLGSHLLYELVREHEEVVALKRPSSKLEEVKKVFGYYTDEVEELFVAHTPKTPDEEAYFSILEHKWQEFRTQAEGKEER